MNTTPATERFWDALIGFIRAGQVIPIVGRELLLVEYEGRQVALMDLLAERLAAELRDEGLLDEGPDTASLRPDVSTVIARVRDKSQRTEVVARAQQLLGDLCAQVPTPEPLRQLAEISSFRLFVSTTIDGLLADHLHRVAPGGLLPWQRIAYHPDKPRDTVDLDRASPWDAPIVYQLYGARSSTPGTGAVTDEELIEFTAALQDPQRRPTRLSDELRNHHLLVLGAGFPDWLARFLLHLLKGESFSRTTKGTGAYIADSEARPDTRLGFFLERFSHKTRLCPGDTAADFVAELHRRWMVSVPSGDEARPGGVFISYSRADLPAVERLAARLTQAGIRFWFDKRELQPGDPFWQVIERNIAVSPVFLPVLSETTRNRTAAAAGDPLKAGFWREWLLAAGHLQDAAAGQRCVMPLVVDDNVTAHEDYLPDPFRQVHIAHCPAGQPPDALLRSINRALQPKGGFGSV